MNNPHAWEHKSGQPRTVKSIAPVIAFLTAFLAAFLTIMPVSAQDHGSDPASARLREELAVVTDLGRLLGFVLRMENEQPQLALNRDQVNKLWQITEEIHRTDRLTPTRSRAMMEEIEDRILTPAQLMHTDQLFLNREQTRVPGSGTAQSTTASPGATGGGTPGARGGADSGGVIGVYQAGGPYNPIRDPSRQLGQDFAALRTHLAARRR